MSYLFSKPPALVALSPTSIREQTLYHAGQSFTERGEQHTSVAFRLYWLSQVREAYRASHKAHPRSKEKRRAFLRNYHAMYRSPSRFLRFYLSRNNDSTIGDPTGNYFLPLPHQNPTMLADNFTHSLMSYWDKPPKIRYTNKATGYGFVQLFVPAYVSMSKPKHGQIKWKKKGGTQISGYLTAEIIRECIFQEIKWYVRQFESSMDPRYLNYLTQKLGNLK